MSFRLQPFLAAGAAVILAAVTGSAQEVSGLGGMPLYFETLDQQGAPPGFLAHGRDGQVRITATGAAITLRDHSVVGLRFLGANARPQISGESELAGKINYLTGNDPSRWQTGVPTFAKVSVSDLYPGIEAVYYGNQRQLEYDFNLAAGVSPDAIAIRFSGADQLSIDALGELVVSAGGSRVLQPKPVIYQEVAGCRHYIDGGYRLADSRTAAFAVGGYDHRLPLVIDPVLSYSSFLAGGPYDAAWAVAVNTNDGSIFVAGNTVNAGLGTNSYQTNYQGGTQTGDAFVAKFDASFNLKYFTYLGGNSEDAALSLAVDKAGNAFVGGYTVSPNFPVTNTIPGYTNVPGLSSHIGGAVNNSGEYYLDGFVSELNTNGTQLLYSTYVGGSHEDAVENLAIDAADNVYFVGYTLSTNLPVKNPIQCVVNGSSVVFSNLVCPYSFFNCNAFVGKIATHGTNLDYLSYWGGTNFDFGCGIAVDSAGCAYFTGYTSSTNFPTVNAFQTYLNQSTNFILAFDGFVTKLDPTGTNVIYSTFLGNTNSDEAYAITVDSHNAAYVTGWTCSTNFYNTNSSGRVIINDGVTNNADGIISATNAFLTKITNTATSYQPNHPAGIAWSTVFGGLNVDIGYGVAVDPAGNVFVTGSTSSPTFPTNNAPIALQALAGNDDAFVTAFNPSGTAVLYSVLLGGINNDYGYGIAVDAAGSAYVVGQTFSGNFPVTTNTAGLPIYSARQTRLVSSSDAFLSKILLNYVPALQFERVGSHQISLSWSDLTSTNITSVTNVLETTTNLSPANWTVLTNLPPLTNHVETVTLPATNPAQFFRLSQ